MEDLIAYVTCQCGEHTPPRLPPLHESGEERASLSSVSASLCNIRSLFFTPGSFLSLFWTVFVDMWFGRPLSSTRWWSDIALLLAAQPLAVLSLFPNGRVPLTASNECLIVASILQHYCVWAHCFLFCSILQHYVMQTLRRSAVRRGGKHYLSCNCCQFCQFV